MRLYKEAALPDNFYDESFGMEENTTGKHTLDLLSESDLVALLSTLRKEPTPEAHFEERFLYDFHERVAREAVCRPARKLLWEHVRQFISNLGGRKLAYGASTLGFGALALGFYSVPETSATSKVAARSSAIVGKVEDSIAALKPGAAREFTCISVGCDEAKSFTRDRMAVAHPTSFASAAQEEPDVLYVSSFRPINMGLSTGMDETFPSLSTNLAF